MKKYTIEEVDTTGLTLSQLELIEKLNARKSYDVKDSKKSIMGYEQLCSCDDGFLCEHRLNIIVKYFKEETTISYPMSKR